MAKSLWYATNKGYGKALDSFLQVKTEQQVRAKEEDSSADFSKEQPVTELVPVEEKFTVDAPILSDKAAWAARLRELSGLFKQFPDVFLQHGEPGRLRTRRTILFRPKAPR